MRNRLLVLVVVAAACLVSSAQTSPNLFPIQEGFVDSHGALIYYMSVGRGAPLMIAHGGAGARGRAGEDRPRGAGPRARFLPAIPAAADAHQSACVHRRARFGQVVEAR